ncbi:uncharacterized protein VP01_4273g1 [Puccinia sorghi]|uniref:Uncharacterized protein n=1 Tax=Puccinia sorghi TaxID=27349 RepID=A0A0L6UQA4_9BASI|nr:uncharacterized protein VP01_4273g1 [Puccinia sorghi]
MMAEPQHATTPQFNPTLVHHSGLSGMHPLSVRALVLIDELKSDDAWTMKSFEVLLALAGELNSTFVEFLGSPKFAHLLLVPLKNLITVKEMLICDKVQYMSITYLKIHSWISFPCFFFDFQEAESPPQIAALLSAQHLEEYYVPAMKRLSVAELFTSRWPKTRCLPRNYWTVNVDSLMAWRLERRSHEVSHSSRQFPL